MKCYERAIALSEERKGREYYIAHLNMGSILVEASQLLEGMDHLKIAYSRNHPQIESVLRRSGLILLFQHSGLRRAIRAVYSQQFSSALRELEECRGFCVMNPLFHFLAAKA